MDWVYLGMAFCASHLSLPLELVLQLLVVIYSLVEDDRYVEPLLCRYLISIATIFHGSGTFYDFTSKNSLIVGDYVSDNK